MPDEVSTAGDQPFGASVSTCYFRLWDEMFEHTICARNTCLFLIAALFALSSCSTRPLMNTSAIQEGLASYYSNDFQGRKTSNGEIFDNAKLTAAHRSYPFGTLVQVTNLDNERKVTVRINDRGPVKPERVIDLTYAAAKVVGIDHTGLGHVRLQVLEWGAKQARSAKR